MLTIATLCIVDEKVPARGLLVLDDINNGRFNAKLDNCAKITLYLLVLLQICGND